MNLSHIKNNKSIDHLGLLAKQVVEGFITGLHKSPFHGFSVEFAEHRLYNKGENTKHIDWKLFAKTEKLFVKRYEEETNLRCHIIIDNSASMHYPIIKAQSVEKFNKIGFSTIAAASLIEVLKRQRDAFGLTIYSDKSDYYSPTKGSEKHQRMLLVELEKLLHQTTLRQTETYDVLHELANKIHRRSLIILFTDMLQTNKEREELFEAIRHLKYNKHELVLFHTYDDELERKFDFDNKPKKFIDVETNETINLYADQVKDIYKKEVDSYFEQIKLICLQNKIDYVPVNIHKGLEQVLSGYLISRKRFL